MQAKPCINDLSVQFSGYKIPEHTVGVFNGEGPPVPIPNTEVKLIGADNTCLATDWKDRSTPTQRVWFNAEPFVYAFLAQW